VAILKPSQKKLKLISRSYKDFNSEWKHKKYKLNVFRRGCLWIQILHFNFFWALLKNSSKRLSKEFVQKVRHPLWSINHLESLEKKNYLIKKKFWNVTRQKIYKNFFLVNVNESLGICSAKRHGRFFFVLIKFSIPTFKKFVFFYLYFWT